MSAWRFVNRAIDLADKVIDKVADRETKRQRTIRLSLPFLREKRDYHCEQWYDTADSKHYEMWKFYYNVVKEFEAELGGSK